MDSTFMNLETTQMVAFHTTLDIMAEYYGYNVSILVKDACQRVLTSTLLVCNMAALPTLSDILVI